MTIKVIRGLTEHSSWYVNGFTGLGFRGRNKIQDVWEDLPHCVLERVDPDKAVYKVVPVDQSRLPKNVHRSELRRCGPLQKEPVRSREYQGIDSGTSTAPSESEEDWEELRLVVQENLSSGVEREVSAEEVVSRDDEKSIFTSTDSTVRRSQRTRAGQHSNPFREPRSVQGMEAAAIPTVLSCGVRPPSSEIGAIETVLDLLLQTSSAPGNPGNQSGRSMKAEEGKHSLNCLFKLYFNNRTCVWLQILFKLYPTTTLSRSAAQKTTASIFDLSLKTRREMGDEQSRAAYVREQETQKMNSFRSRVSNDPDMRVSQGIQMFTSLSASDNLRQHYEKRKLEAGGHAAEWSKNLVEKLGNLLPAPELTGLLALVIAIIIDTVSSSLPEESTKDILRSVFAEEKASEVWDQIDECLKRCEMNINNRGGLMSDIKRIEGHLSAAITKLKNSMLRDGHMSNQALKAWVNGAAFHIQMLIQLVRLEGTPTCDPAERLLSLYRRDLELLFNKHEEVIKGKCREKKTGHPKYYFEYYLVDEDANEFRTYGDYKKYLEAYYDHRYGQQKRDIQQYFSGVNQNLKKLVHQTGSFNIN
ncbi:uncharacterized protein LOC120488449 [Pimephales promelas]|uniref:uncharacterized protein LOC120488449 n=1 Tax=Pimephales promelas TaxID=90988 RepID=UPI0019556545|nr:uncharacterized protein LOC120488449 [Pimephales promelas]